jgi:hypothetical protein
MKKYLLLLLLAAAFVPAARAGVDVNINIGLPAVKVDDDPVMVFIPGTYIYFIAGHDADIFFYQGYWWRHHNGRWYRAGQHRGPWAFYKTGRVPPGLLRLPKDWRKLPPGHPSFKSSVMKQSWKQWEKEKHWDKKEQKQDNKQGNQPNDKSSRTKSKGKGKS